MKPSETLSEAARKALRDLWDGERPSDGFSRRKAFPGAVGRGGTALARCGLAENMGRTVYAGSSRRGERPEAWVQFRLTDAGRARARELFGESEALRKPAGPQKPSKAKRSKPCPPASAPVASAAVAFLVHRPIMDYEESITPYFVCLTREAADAAVNCIGEFMAGLLKRLPRYPEEQTDAPDWEEAAGDLPGGASDAWFKADRRKNAILSKARWPLGLGGLGGDVFWQFEEWTWNTASVAVIELPILQGGAMSASAAKES